jgi:hypothetical protein
MKRERKRGRGGEGGRERGRGGEGQREGERGLRKEKRM